MDYFNDDLLPFWALKSINEVAVYRGIRKLSHLIKNILTCVLKINEGLTGFERHFNFWLN